MPDSPKNSKLPAYLAEGVNTDAPNVDLPNVREAELIKALVRYDQVSGYQAALRYAEEEILNKDIKTFTPERFEIIFKRINQLVTFGIQTINNPVAIPGTYSPLRSNIKKETGDSRFEFIESSTPFVPQNKIILNILYGKEAGDLYEEFCHKYEAELEKKRAWYQETYSPDPLMPDPMMVHLAGLKEGDISRMKASGLKKDQGYKWYQKIYGHGPSPKKIPSKINTAFTELVKKIKDQEDPVQIAALALSLGYTHAFAEGNGRSSRILAYALMKYFNIAPPKLTDRKKHYQHIQKLKENPEELVKYLQEEIKNNKAETTPGFTNEGKIVLQELSNDIFIKPEPKLYEMGFYNEDFVKELPEFELSLIISHWEESSSRAIRLPISSDYCRSKGIEYQDPKKFPYLGIYFFLKEAKFRLENKEPGKAADSYIGAAQICERLGLAISCYTYAQVAKLIYLGRDPPGHKEENVIADEKMADLISTDLEKYARFAYDDFEETQRGIVSTYDPTFFTRYGTLDLKKALGIAEKNNKSDDIKALKNIGINLNAEDKNPTEVKNSVASSI